MILLDPGKDEDAIAYLTQALVARIQTLKQEEPEQNTRSRGMTRYEGHPRDIQVGLQNLQTAELEFKNSFLDTSFKTSFSQDPGLASMLAARTQEAQEAEAQDGA